MNKSLNSSKKVILDCILDNGAIVAANATKSYYPSVAKNYFYIWPRDGSFTCLALDALGMTGIQEKFFTFLSSRMAGWKETGLFYEKYYPNGAMVITKKKFQPDQTGEVLFAVWQHFKDNKNGVTKYKRLITHSADGLCKVWNGKTITLVSNDIWEERLSFPDLQEDFTYSLAACSKGLECANKFFPNKRYVKVAKEMRAAIIKKARKHKYFIRSIVVLDDVQIDASMLGLFGLLK